MLWRCVDKVALKRIQRILFPFVIAEGQSDGQRCTDGGIDWMRSPVRLEFLTLECRCAQKVD